MMLMRIVLLLGISWLVQIQKSLFSIDYAWISTTVTLQSIILLLGGLFLIYKSTREIFDKVENVDEAFKQENNTKFSFSRALVQIVLIDIVFSFDSILTAIGMTNGIPYALPIMIAAVVVAIFIMMLFATPVSSYINDHPSLQILGLSFLLLIGFMLITEAAHLSQTSFFGASIGTIPKGYLYFAIAFSLGVEMINMRFRKGPKH
jgi:predicted tellurium resistance membrane protein TerC